MKVTCISASNMKQAGDKSTYLTVCNIIEKIIKTEMERDDIQVDIVTLVGAELSPCTGCGNCFKTGQCNANDDFNIIYSRIAASGAIFIISPHYAPIPAKLSILLEKMEQISYLHWFHDNNYQPTVYRIPEGIIAHGGGSDESALRSYKYMVLDTIANALQTIMMEVVGLDGEWPTGMVFSAKEVIKDEDEIFPIQFYDWVDIENRMKPLVERVMEKADSHMGKYRY
jgi:multimeric flavodoxin WrbA